MSDTSAADQYKDTVTLPQTAFEMRGFLNKNEPKIQAKWDEMDLFGRMRAESAGKEKFVLHDGPPYANGDLHIGHALNKILKDTINRAQQMQGKDAHYVPGWDCHGLPIEWKVEERYRDAGQDKDDVDVVEFRRECREFAQSWVEKQTEQFKRLGILGNWDNPYLTMHYKAEGQIVRELGKFLANGSLYKGAKPVLWSVVEKTALADAEVEYHDHKSVTIWVKFPIRECPNNPELVGANAVIWTTTTWTIPANRAMAFNRDIAYGHYRIDAVADGSLNSVGDRFVIADDLIDSVVAQAKIDSVTRLGDAGDLTGTVAAHPLHAFQDEKGGFDHAVPLFHGDYVTAESGTGLVHIAPGHGFDDWVLAHKENGIAVPQTVAEDGSFYDHMPLVAGLTVFDQKGKDGTCLGPILRALTEHGGLMAKGKMTHSYPHSWRSKAPLIYRNTAQWFIPMEDSLGDDGIRAKALASIDETRFIPASGSNRLRGMIEQRPDWCISRQRVWGVPLPLFVNKTTGEPLNDPAVIDRIAAAFDEEGGDAWFDSAPSRFLGDAYNADDFEQVRDVVEVWFDSGSTHAFVLEARPELKWPADLYLEGSDQHRGWFHSSLLVGAGTRGRAPYDAVLTHGFVLDEKGQKMSKSLGNVVSPADVANAQGIDILRLWVVASDYNDDLRIGKAILKQQEDAYRRFRNTFRYLLGNLAGYSTDMAVPYEDLPELERWVLSRLARLSTLVEDAANSYDFHAMYTELSLFAGQELSAFYFDVRKDALYCDDKHDVRRRACQTVLAEVFKCMTAWMAPILVHTCEEAWWKRAEDEKTAGIVNGIVDTESVHLRTNPSIPTTWADDALNSRFDVLRGIRKVVLSALEPLRAAKEIGSSLEAAPTVYLSGTAEIVVDMSELADLCIVSQIRVEAGDGPAEAVRLDDVAGVAVVPTLAEGDKCQRCWKTLPEVEGKDLCQRCDHAIATS